jgi:hypothetical protein
MDAAPHVSGRGRLGVEQEYKMKKILLAAAAIAVIASPALAQTGWRKAPAPSYGQAVPFGALGAYAQSPRGATVSPYAQGGDYVGTDPDPNIQLQLLKDAQSRE